MAVRRLDADRAGRSCTIYAFSTQDPATLAVDQLVAGALSLDAETIGGEALPYPGLSPWRGRGRPYGSFTIVDDEVAVTLSDPPRGRYVFSHLHLRTSPERGLVVWARWRGVDYIHPVQADLTC